MAQPDHLTPGDKELGRALLSVARQAIAERLGAATTAPPAHTALAAPGACFVTLTQHGELRGCVGSLEARRSLIADVREHALGAAFRDSRFAPLTVGELPITRVEVSLLTSQAALTFENEADLLAQLRPGVDGLVLRYGEQSSTFLPQVWETLSEPRDFLAQLKRKAGLPANFWHPDIHVARYTVTKWKESGKESAEAEAP